MAWLAVLLELARPSRRWRDRRGAWVSVAVVAAVAITGDRATATVTYHFERSPEDKVTTPMVFTRDGEDWKVCSPGPG